jgi:predicted dehydrogenase
VGCGHIAGVHARAWEKTGISEVAGVFDVNKEAATAFARRFGIAKAHDSMETLIDAVDVIDDCSPPHVHVNVALETLGRRRHYLVEKPMVLSSTDLDRVLEAQRASGCKISVIHNLKYNPGIQTARKWINGGRIGRLLSLERHFLTDPVTDRMLRAENHWSHRLPGGRWVETLPHELYITFEFLGPLEVDHVQTLRLPNSPHPHTADEMMVTLQGESAVASFRFSARCGSNIRTLTLHGSEGSIGVELLAGTAVLYRPRTMKWVRGVGLETLNAFTTLGRMIPDRTKAIKRRATRETPHSRLIRDFAFHVTGKGPMSITTDEIEYVVRTGEEISHRAAGSAVSSWDRG